VRGVTCCPRLLSVMVALALSGCVVRPRMCDTRSGCPAHMACVVGRCQREGADPAIMATRRIVLDPTAIAYLRRGDPASGAGAVGLFTLGRRGDGDELLLLRFEAPLAADAVVVEAYVLLERSDAVDMDPTPIGLYAARVVGAWDPRAVSWATQPSLQEVRSPVTLVPAAGQSLVRVDVRGLVKAWQRHDPRDQGIGIVADNASTTGATFASGRLELYVK
jgi:hypothetical protein